MTETTIEKHRAVIAVAAITPPRGKSRSYTLHTHDGNEFSLWPDKIGLIRTDEQFDVEYTAKAADNGRTYYNIVGTPKNVGPYRAHSLSAAAVETAMPNGNGNGNKDDMISALALYNHSFATYVTLTRIGTIDQEIMGNFLYECMCAVRHAKSRYDGEVARE